MPEEVDTDEVDSIDDVVPDELLPHTVERPRGILTKREREFLLGESDVSASRARAIRQAVREHLTHTLLDFRVLLQGLEERDRRRVFDAAVKIDGEQVPTGYVRTAAKDAVGFLSREFIDEEYQHAHEFAGVVEDGIQRAGATADDAVVVEADVTIDLETPETVDERLSRLEEQGVEALTLNEIEKLRDDGIISYREYAELLIKKDESLDGGLGE